MADVPDGSRRATLPSDLDHFRRVHDLSGRLHHGVAYRRREEQRLPAGWERSHDSPHAGPEAHVQHPVGLIENQHLEPAEIGGPAAQVVEKTSWRRDDEIHPSAQGALLGVGAHAPVHGRSRERGVVGKALKVIFNLHGQLACRREHEHACGGFRTRRAGFTRDEQPLHDRQQECDGFSSSGFGACDEVGAVRYRVEDCGLDWGRSDEPAVRQALRKPRIKPKRRELDGRGIVRQRLERTRSLCACPVDLAGAFARAFGETHTTTAPPAPRAR
jgi:hypothetical protein